MFIGKNIYRLGFSLLMGILVSACDSDEGTAEFDEPTPEPTLETPLAPTLIFSSDVNVSAKGGEYSVGYTIDNPDDNGYVTCSGNVSWLSDFDTSVEGTIGFTVAENLQEAVRNGKLLVTYMYSEGYITQDVEVVQEAAAFPAIEVQSETVNASFEAGTYSFSYTLLNPADDGELTSSANVEWIRNLDCSVDGTVSFAVTENEGLEVRNGEITLTYTYSRGTLSGTVAVVQNFNDYDEGFVGILSDMLGTYDASGEVFVTSMGAAEQQTWTLKIYQRDESTVIIDGMVPSIEGWYLPDSEDGTEAYIAYAYLDEDNHFVVPAQFTGYYSQYGDYAYFIGYTACTQYVPGYGFGYDTRGSACTFTYSSLTGTWTSDDGIILGLFTTSGNFSTLTGYIDVVVSSITLKKTSSDTNAVTSTKALSEDRELEMHTDFNLL